MSSRPAWVEATLLAFVVALPVAAQKPKPVATVSGSVTDGTHPLGQATVELLGTKLVRLTSGDGRFQFDSLKPGPYWIKVRRIGFAPTALTATLLADQPRNLQIRLEAIGYQLPDLEVPGGMTETRFAEFRWRKATAWGKFLTRDDIARIRPFDLVDLVQRNLPYTTRFLLEGGEAFEISGGPLYESDRWRRPAPLRRPCAPAVSVQGGTPGYSLRDFGLEDVEAVEVYRGNHVPVEFGRRWDRCGLVVLWLR